MAQGSGISDIFESKEPSFLQFEIATRVQEKLEYWNNFIVAATSASSLTEWYTGI